MVDLHTHSTCSDGTLTPTELVALAAQSGITALALCDHNNVDGLPEFLEAAAIHGIDAVPGVEFSTEYQGAELHILGLFIREERYEAVRTRLAKLLEDKDRSNRDLIRSLAGEGIELDYAAIKAATPGGLVNRAVIAADMVRRGYCGSVQEAFNQWLSPKRGHFHPPKRPDALDTISFIRSIGAVAVLAHPFLNLESGSLRRFLEEAVPLGLQAMEVFYPSFTPAQTAEAEKLVREFDLLPSGGSDFHGENKPHIRLGTGRGDLRVPRSWFEALRAVNFPGK